MKKIVNNLDKIIITIIIIFFIFFGIKFNHDNDKEKNEQFLITESTDENITKSSEINTQNENSNESSKIKEEKEIVVHITGCVINQGVYTLNANSRVNDLVKLAGGLCKDADLERINLSSKLTDEMKIHIYKIGENDKSDILDKQAVEPKDQQSESNPKTKKININTATIDELTTLTGIGKAKATEIIEYRKNTKFSKIEDLMNISGIGNKTFEKIKEMITID
ncbi:helix-hairpin-helix domain-containing protein [Helcococcus kunzii]|uniref:ComEA protein n=1 Tax=Helcococcus kunzii ATCC 51366 TaxID=883114 RepID=H3NMV9_9FIRM|nr:helix-hairpin-helix domain-containing protein [Helcococcus kunzii]EHR34700.1 comEA protein [Helcococcus kunzii ATCC 51366]MCT1795354.1 helix-hairpin-helix domain-containing protein [Helcococcus kunzii]MCT1989535.1 helix-hairpin-helix domain-containing protein [Helcococcus kunzii]QZO77025.1 helix-hairpin-helix domain-containing protein [Helcococcus kunzii]